jgi:hypothetical protein
MLIFTTVHYSFSQPAENDKTAVNAVINKLFKAMQLGDSAMARSTFTKDVTTATVFKDKAGNVVLRQENSISDFMKAIGTQRQSIWYEEIWNVKTELDGDFAQVWCDYAFYLDKTFSHCGVDAFHLYKGKDGWKIFHLADTRRKSDSEIPQDIQDKHQ